MSLRGKVHYVYHIHADAMHRSFKKHAPKELLPKFQRYLNSLDVSLWLARLARAAGDSSLLPETVRPPREQLCDLLQPGKGELRGGVSDGT